VSRIRELVVRADHALGERVSVRSLAVVRCLVGAITVVHLTPIAVDAAQGHTYHDHFHQPYAPWAPEFGPTGFTVLLWVGVLASIAMSIGWSTRLATVVATSVVGYHLLQSTTHVHNNRAYLFAVLLILSMSRAGNAMSVDAWRARRSGRPLPAESPAWPLWLLRFECATVYGASGLSKLLDPDWFGGTVTWGRVTAQEAMVRSSILPDVVVDLLLDRSFHTYAAKAIVFTELFIAIGLWWPRTRRWAVATAVVFHVMIELSAEVQVFSSLGIAVLVVWADPSIPWTTRRMLHNRHMAAATTPSVAP